MKKWMALLMALLLALSLAPAPAEETAPETDPALLGDWYAEMQNIALTLTLNENGQYALSYPALPDAAREGTWELRDGYVYLDGDEEEPLNFTGDKLIWGAARVFFYRESPQVYAPADPDPSASLTAFAGAWRSAYALANGAALPAGLVDQDVRLYVEIAAPDEAAPAGQPAARAAIIGGPFADSALDFTFENGALSFADETFSLQLAMQTDSLLRLTLAAGGETLSLVCVSYLTEGLLPDPEPAQ